MSDTWRDRARPIIQKVLQETAGKPEDEIRKALKAAYPFGERERYPYKIWLDEIKVQRGTKQKKSAAKLREELKNAGQLEFMV